MSQEILTRLHSGWQKHLLDNKDARAILTERHHLQKIDSLKALELGLAKIPAKADMPDTVFRALDSFGIMDESITGMVSLPLRRKDNRLVNFLFLSLNGKNDRIAHKGGIINGKAFRAFKRIIVVDNLADFFAYFDQVKENIVPIIQSDHMMVDFAEMLASSKVEEIMLINDSPYWTYLKEKIAGTDADVYEIALPDKETVTQFLEARSANKLVAYFEGEKAKIIRESKEQDERDNEYFSLTIETGEIRFTGEDRMYRVRGFNRDGFEKIVQIALDMDGRTFPDKLDLSRSQGRGRFANIAAAEFEMSPDILRKDLAYIYKKLDELQDERFREKLGLREKNVHILTPDDERKAIDRLNKRDILNEILIKDTESLGYVEEEVNKKLFYISAASRLTGKPLSVLDISPPGTGKSFGLSSIIELMPPDEVLMYSRLTPHALYYKSEDELRGRVLYIEELVGMEESLEPIRMLLSSGELAVSVVEKDARTGQLRTVERRIKVDIPIISSGVRDIFDEETLSRFILTYNDVTPDHLQRILKAQAYKYSMDGEKVILQKDRFFKKHRDIQKVLDKNLVVVNPFADKIMVNPRLHIVTRKQEQYLRLMYNIAFLRQHRRPKRKEIDRNGNAFTYIEVMKEDVETANEIAVRVFKYAQGDLTKALHDAYSNVKALILSKVKESRRTIFEVEVSKKELMDRYNWPETTARRYLDDLVTHEYLVRVKISRHKQFAYRLLLNDDGIKNSGLSLLEPAQLNTIQ